VNSLPKTVTRQRRGCDLNPRPSVSGRLGNRVVSVLDSGVVVRERGGTPFRLIFWSRNGAPANIVGFIFLVPAHPGSTRHRAIKWVCVCVCVLIFYA